MSKTYSVHAEWDSRACVWTASSDDVPGLATEAVTIEGLNEKLRTLVPELLEANACMPSGGPVCIELLARRISVACLSVN